MYARVTTVYFQPGMADAVTQYVSDTVVPTAKQAKGFGGIVVLSDPASNKGIAITYWDTEADMAAGESSSGYYAQAMAGAAQFLSAPPVRETYEVRIKE
jgi:heme-degrading monooxygenase HmoA